MGEYRGAGIPFGEKKLCSMCGYAGIGQDNNRERKRVCRLISEIAWEEMGRMRAAIAA